MTLLSLLAVAWLVSVPASGTTLLQDTSAAQSNPAPDYAPAKPAQNTPPKAEPPAAEQGPPDSAEKKKTETAPHSTPANPAQNAPSKAEPPAAEQGPPDSAEKKKTETAPTSVPANPEESTAPKAVPPAAEQGPPDSAEKKKTETAPASPPANPEETTPPKAEPPAAEPGAPDSAEKKEAENTPVSKVAKTRRVRNGAPKARRIRKSTPKPTTPGQPRKVVVREGGAVEPSAQIVPGLPPQEADRQRQHAVQLLASADDNLKRLSDRILDSRQQETVAQIHNYADGARSALKDGDTQRAHTLALKAHLLADDLVKH